MIDNVLYIDGMEYRLVGVSANPDEIELLKSRVAELEKELDDIRVQKEDEERMLVEHFKGMHDE